MNEIKNRLSYNLILLLIFGVILLPSILAQSGEIKGKILPSDSNAIVYAISPTQEVAGNTTIDINGEYSFELPIGVYDLFIRARGEYNDKAVFQIGIRDNETIEIQDITLSRIGETGSISGYVNPVIEDAVIYIKKFGLSDISQVSRIKWDGSYEFNDLEPDTYGIFVNFNSTQDFYNYKWGMIDIYSDSNLTGINLTFSPRINNYLIDRIIVEFQPEISESEKIDVIYSFNSRIMSHYSYSRFYTIATPSDKSIEEMVELFETNPKVKDADLYRIAHIASGNEPVEESVIDEEVEVAQEIEEKINIMESIIERTESINTEKPETSIYEDVLTDNTSNYKKSNGNATIAGFLILIVIIIVFYLVKKWKKRI